MSEKYNLHKAMQITESWVESQLHHFLKAAVTLSPTSVDNEARLDGPCFYNLCVMMHSRASSSVNVERK